MYSSLKNALKNDLEAVTAAAAAIGAALVLSSCGGGGGDTEDISSHPAPQTMNALVFTPWPSGPQFTFIRGSGSALNGGTETGGFLYTPGEASDDPAATAPDNTAAEAAVTGVSYTYQKTGPETGTLIISGNSTPADNSPDYLVGDFSRQYDITFITDGNLVTRLQIDDYDLSADTADIPNPAWPDATLHIYQTNSLTVGYSLDFSETQQLPYLYPDSVDTETMEVERTAGAAGPEPLLRYIFNQSDFITAEYGGSPGDYDEIGNVRISRPSAPLSVDDVVLDFPPGPSYLYKRDIQTRDKAQLRIYDSSGGTYDIIYTLTFTNTNSGSFTANNGDSGDFLFSTIPSS